MASGIQAAMNAAEVLILVIAIYATVGVLFAAAFVTCGVARIDPAAHNAPIGFRLLILPAAAALWPYLLRRWAKAPHAENS
jgi:hypothetical protein